MGVRFSFRWLLVLAYTSRYLQAPSGVAGVTYRDFNLLHRPLLKRFPLFGFCLAVSSVPSFRPDTGGRRWSLIRVAGSVALRGGAGAAFPVRCSGSRLLYMERVLRCTRFQPSGVPQKPGTKSCACFLRLPHQSCSGCQELDGRTLPGCSAPSARCIPSPSPRPRRSGACALCLDATLLEDVDHPESQEVFD